ncbi:MAG TPA: bifunctional enoyl-CoA hydratase/phosphate acetyltransferase [Caldisericia bacterium]|nr:bifunctional enoyl-CoA hydratase/phosphate acetyltransferase [Caldisericia bacterium]HXK51499.1 bifunctional enoyl-CoA hydratase/phosphate acetyltransferase [Caldisericia bacterium]
MIHNFEEARKRAMELKPVKMAVVSAGDKAVLDAVFQATKDGFVHPILIDTPESIQKESQGKFPLDDVEIIPIQGKTEQCQKGLELINNGSADILMKGLIPTPILFKEVLNKEYGIRKGKILSHVGVIKSPVYHKMILMTDGGICIAPTLEEKIEILKNALEVSQGLEIDYPKVAAISAVETVSLKMQSTIDASILTTMNRRKQIPGCIIEGPLAIDNAVSAEAAEHKGIHSEVCGDVDITLMPNIESGNIFYKVLVYLGGGKTESAGVTLGAKVPIVVPSRADTPENKYNAILIAALMSAAKTKN